MRYSKLDRGAKQYSSFKLEATYGPPESKRKATANRVRVRLAQKAEAAALERKWPPGGVIRTHPKNNYTMAPIPPQPSNKEQLRREAECAYEEWLRRTPDE